ncbi:MAG: Hsp20/alpha crystallin family protein [Planctomycetota bacterium]|jgi:HSP20 family protein
MLCNRLENKVIRSPWDNFLNMSDNLSSFFSVDCSNRSFGSSCLDINTGEDEIQVKAELPGIEKKDLEILIQDKVLTLKVTRSERELQDSSRYLRRECQAGGIVKKIALPYEIEESTSDACYEKGILKITLSRAESDKPRIIQVTG